MGHLSQRSVRPSLLAEPRAWQEGCPPLIPHPLSQRPGKEPSSSVSWASAPLGEQRKGGSADLFNGDGPATPDTVHLALSGLFVPVQVGTLSRLEEKKKRQVRGAQSGRGTAARLEPRPPALPRPGQALVVGRGRGGGPGRRGREGTETTRIPTGLFLHTAPYRAAQVTERAAPHKRARTRNTEGARGAQPRALGRKRRGGARRGGQWAEGWPGAQGTTTDRGEPSPEVSGQWPGRAQTPRGTLHRPRRRGPRGTVDGEREERGQRGPAPLPGSWGRARPKAGPRKRGGQEGGRQAAVLASRAEQERGVHAGRSGGQGRESAPREPRGRAGRSDAPAPRGLVALARPGRGAGLPSSPCSEPGAVRPAGPGPRQPPAAGSSFLAFPGGGG